MKIDGRLMNAGKKEPLNLKEWPALAGQLYSCARPGRGTHGKKRTPVDTSVLRRWLKNLPAVGALHMISLLGRKADGMSEFVYYPFRSCEDDDDGRPTFQEWLRGEMTPHIVYEFPTCDRLPLQPRDARDRAVTRTRELLEAGRAVLVVDSGGVERTGALCNLMLASGTKT